MIVVRCHLRFLPLPWCIVSRMIGCKAVVLRRYFNVYLHRWLSLVAIGRSCPSRHFSPRKWRLSSRLALACDDDDSLPLGASIRLIVVLYAISSNQSTDFFLACGVTSRNHCHDNQLISTYSKGLIVTLRGDVKPLPGSIRHSSTRSTSYRLRKYHGPDILCKIPQQCRLPVNSRPKTPRSNASSRKLPSSPPSHQQTTTPRLSKQISSNGTSQSADHRHPLRLKAAYTMAASSSHQPTR